MSEAPDVSGGTAFMGPNGGASEGKTGFGPRGPGRHGPWRSSWVWTNAQ